MMEFLSEEMEMVMDRLEDVSTELDNSFFTEDELDAMEQKLMELMKKVKLSREF